jgi:hypothetical protein
MRQFVRRFLLPNSLLAGCVAFLLSVTPPAESQDKSKSPQKSKSPAKKKTGPGGDDDRPVTMLGGTLILAWDDPLKFGDAFDHTGLYQYSAVGTANKIELTFRDRNSGQELTSNIYRKGGQHLTIDVQHGGTSEMSFKTDTTGFNLLVTSVLGFGSYKGEAKQITENPQHEKKVNQINFTGVVSDGTLPTQLAQQGAKCDEDTAAHTINCQLNQAHATRSVLKVHVCANILSTGCEAPH